MLSADVVANGHLIWMLCGRDSSLDNDVKDARRLMRWLRDNRNEVAAMNRGDECRLGCFTVAYVELGQQLDNMQAGLAMWEPRVMAIFEYHGREYGFVCRYVHSYGMVVREPTWTFVGDGATRQHADTVGQSELVRQAKLVHLDEPPHNPLLTVLDITLAPGNNLLGSLQEVVRRLASV